MCFGIDSDGAALNWNGPILPVFNFNFVLGIIRTATFHFKIIFPSESAGRRSARSKEQTAFVVDQMEYHVDLARRTVHVGMSSQLNTSLGDKR